MPEFAMLIKSVTLQNFRNFRTKTVRFDENTIVIVGPNASGKTNILESVYLLSSGRSFHAGREEEMIRNGAELGRVIGLLTADSGQYKLEVLLTRGEINGERVARKKVSINGVSKRVFNFAGILKSVLFGPWDLNLITQSPSIRRRFLDGVLSQVDREYRRNILSYEKGIRQRNRLLERIREGEASKHQLLFWNNLLIRDGEYITTKREEFIDFVNRTDQLDHSPLSLIYDKSAISEGRLEKYAEQEVASATTLVGPHRDDFGFSAGGRRDLGVYGSRGEQRMGVLWLKLAELSFIEQASGERPVLLLDDIFSELDHDHRDIVKSIVGKQQTIITTADPHTIENWKKKAQIIEL